MPVPLDFSTRSGVPRVYRKTTSGSSWEEQTGWLCSSVELGSRDRQHVATIRFNRDPVIRGDDTDVVIGQDSVWCITFQPSGPRNPTLIFEGTPKLIQRSTSGVPGASSDTGELLLQGSPILWADHESSQIHGRYMARIRSGDIDENADLVHDGSVPTVFNPGGLPNRSRATAKDTRVDDGDGGTNGVFAEDFRADVHYFTDDDGRDFDGVFAGDSDTAKRGHIAFPARYWTYAQALAYVLHWHAGSSTTTGSTEPVSRNGIRLWFGYPPGTTPETTGRPRDMDTDTLWGALIGDDRSSPRYKVLQATEIPTDPPGSPPFDDPDDPGPWRDAEITPSALLNARCHDLSIEGMNVIEALGTILHAAGLGYWADCIWTYEVADPDAPTPPDADNEVVFRVWTPGGNTAANPTGIGEQFRLKLLPYRTIQTGNAAAQVFAQNNTESLDATFDCGSILNAPLILKAPTLYEVTCMLRPGWRPFRSQLNGWIDNVNPNTTFEDPPTDPDNPNLINEREDAIATMQAALALPIENVERMFANLEIPPFMRRVKTLWSVMHAKGALGQAFADVLRKWIIPTDNSYADEIFARDYTTFAGSGMTWEHGTYVAVNFAETEGRDSFGNAVPPFILHPITGAEQWPTRRRPMLPMITSDNNKESLGVVVEVSLDGALLDGSGTRPDGKPCTWFQVTGFRVLADECGIYFTFENPFDLKNPTVLPGSSTWPYDNLALSYIHHYARVRATFCVEGSSTADPLTGYTDVLEGVATLPNPSTLRRSRIIPRRNRYGRTLNLGRFKDQTTSQVSSLKNWDDDRAPTGQEIPALYDDSLTELTDPTAKLYYERRIDHTAAARAELSRQQAASGDWKVSGKFVLPWLETDCRPGMVVERLEEEGGGVKRLIDLRSLAGAGAYIGPSIAGVIYTFSAGGMRTLATLEDWRAISELGNA